MSFCFFTIESAIPTNLYFKSMCAAPEFFKGTSLSSVVYKYNIILQFMILLISWSLRYRKYSTILIFISICNG